MKRKIVVFCLALVILLDRFGFVETAASEPIHRHTCTESKKIALTFDDGPHPSLTPKILSILKRYGIRATFFMIGKEIDDYTDWRAWLPQTGMRSGTIRIRTPDFPGYLPRNSSGK